MYYFKPSAYAAVTAVPSEIIKRKLKTSSGNQLKVLLAACFIAAEGIDADKIALLTGLKKSEAEDCLEYWADEELFIVRSGQAEINDAEIPAKTKNKGTEKGEKESADNKIKALSDPGADIAGVLQPEKPTREVIAKRLAESKEICNLFNTVQSILGRTIGLNDQSSILLLHDYYGLKSEIILVLFEHARITGKANNLVYIKDLGKKWSSRGIDTIEQAEAELKRMEKSGKYWEGFYRLSGGFFRANPTEAQTEILAKWKDEWSLSDTVISMGLEQMKNYGAKPTMQYLDKILASWYSAGAVTPEKIQQLQEKKQLEKLAASGPMKRRNTEKKTDANEGASYDLEKALEEAENSEPVFKKRKKQ